MAVVDGLAAEVIYSTIEQLIHYRHSFVVHGKLEAIERAVEGSLASVCVCELVVDVAFTQYQNFQFKHENAFF
jgi:hypothetical protein